MPDSALTPFENRPVTRSRIEIPGAAGGLRDAMEFDAREIAHEEELYVLLRVKCTKIRFDEIKDSDCLARVHSLAPVDGSAGMFMPDEVVEKYLSEHREIMDRERKRKTGQEPIPGTYKPIRGVDPDEEVDAWEAEHGDDAEIVPLVPDPAVAAAAAAADEEGGDGGDPDGWSYENPDGPEQESEPDGDED